ncbi:MAG: SDR family NAD(P)-dependent oxidoreductase [Bacteroidaceae bacterium]|nr:SDR family NAD(P)-dependent oxidoreductase [Bacteroidaceae bacterium]
MENKHRALIVGGANGIGLAIATLMADDDATEVVHVVDKADIPQGCIKPKMRFHRFDLTEKDYSFFDQFDDIDTLMITAGVGRLALFRDIPEEKIAETFSINAIPAMRLVKRYYDRLLSPTPFRCGIMVSVAGYMSSPFLSIYAATKAALRIFIETVNVETEKAGSDNRILNVSPGKIPGTSFDGGETELELVKPLARQIIQHLDTRDDLFIPQYDEIYHNVLNRAFNDFRAEGRHSYDYKVQSGRVKI